jgi:hypothetical protein
MIATSTSTPALLDVDIFQANYTIKAKNSIKMSS